MEGEQSQALVNVKNLFATKRKAGLSFTSSHKASKLVRFDDSLPPQTPSTSAATGTSTSSPNTQLHFQQPSTSTAQLPPPKAVKRLIIPITSTISTPPPLATRPRTSQPPQQFPRLQPPLPAATTNQHTHPKQTLEGKKPPIIHILADEEEDDDFTNEMNNIFKKIDNGEIDNNSGLVTNSGLVNNSQLDETNMLLKELTNATNTDSFSLNENIEDVQEQERELNPPSLAHIIPRQASSLIINDIPNFKTKTNNLFHANDINEINERLAIAMRERNWGTLQSPINVPEKYWLYCNREAEMKEKIFFLQTELKKTILELKIINGLKNEMIGAV